MSVDGKSAEARFWFQQANTVKRKQNLGWWADMSAPLLVFAGIVGFAALFYLRSQGVVIPGWQMLAAVGCAGGIVAVWGYVMARRRFFSIEDAYVRLESKMGLNTALSTAAAGVGEWPPQHHVPEDGADDGVRWRMERLAIPIVAFAAFLCAGWLIPVGTTQAELPPNEPMGWSQMEATLETLEEEQVVEPESLEEMREQIRELRNQAHNDWYSHSSMEATDNLRNKLDSSVQDMADDLSTAERSLEALQNESSALSESSKNKALKDLDAAMKGLENNNMQLNKELMEKLQELDPSQLNQLDKEQLKQLREQLRKAAGT